MAAIDRLVHHSIILDMMSVDSYRAETANQQHLPSAHPKKPSSGRVPFHEATPSLPNLDVSTAEDAHINDTQSARLIATDGTV